MPNAVTTKPKSFRLPILSRVSGWTVPLLVVSAIILLTFYWYRTRLPSVVTIAGGPKTGRYSEVAHGLAQELERRLDINVKVLDTQGSLENLRLLETHSADLGLYQPETRFILEGYESVAQHPNPANFVSNLYPEFMLPVGPSNGRPNLGEIDGRIWCCNDRLSGDYAVTRLLLQHLGIDERDIEMKSVSYAELPTEIREGRSDVAIVCCGLDAAMLKELLNPETAQLLNVPAVDAMAQKNTALHRGIVPAGFFQISPSVPAEDFPTIALQAQLLADTEAPVQLIEEVARIVNDPGFQRRLRLTELLDGGVDYATRRPEYEMHAGAQHVFSPELKPLINPDFVEGTEGIRSFVVSLVAAVWLLHRWWTRRQNRSQEHRLDRYIRDLMQMEQQQMEVDGEGGPEESGVLQRLLDQVTILRQEALSEFTAHELNEDRAAECFIEMCHALSDKINAKLIRHSILSTAAHKNTR